MPWCKTLSEQGLYRLSTTLATSTHVPPSPLTLLFSSSPSPSLHYLFTYSVYYLCSPTKNELRESSTFVLCSWPYCHYMVVLNKYLVNRIEFFGKGSGEAESPVSGMWVQVRGGAGGVCADFPSWSHLLTKCLQTTQTPAFPTGSRNPPHGSWPLLLCPV